MLDTSKLKLVNGELSVNCVYDGNMYNKGVLFLKNDGYNKYAFTVSVDFKRAIDSPGVYTYVMLSTDPAYTTQFVPNVQFRVFDKYMDIMVGGSGAGLINIKPIAANVWHTMILSLSGGKLRASVQTKAGDELGTYTLTGSFKIKGSWGLTGSSLYQSTPKYPIYFDNFCIKQ
jgi:hypothetical protein